MQRFIFTPAAFRAVGAYSEQIYGPQDLYRVSRSLAVFISFLQPLTERSWEFNFVKSCWNFVEKTPRREIPWKINIRRRWHMIENTVGAHLGPHLVLCLHLLSRVIGECSMLSSAHNCLRDAQRDNTNTLNCTYSSLH